MTRAILIAAALLISLLGRVVLAAPASPTSAIEPFVNEYTLAAARLDVAGIDSDALDRWSRQVLDVAGLSADERGALGRELDRTMKDARQWAAEFKDAGGNTIWVVSSIEPLPHGSPTFLVAPLGPGANVERLRKLLAGMAPSGPDHAEILEIHNALVIGSDRGSADWIRAIKPAPRPELAQALSAAGDGRLQVALIPSQDARKVIESMAPTLPDGQPASVLAHGVQWASLAVQSPPDVTARLVIRSPDEQSARDLRESLKSLAQWSRRLQVNAMSKVLVDTAAGLADQIQVQADRVRIDVDSKQSIALAAQIGRSMRTARQVAARQRSVSNIRQLMLGCIMYANNVKGSHFPDTLDQMLREQDISPQVLINPTRPQEKPGYVYVKPPEPASQPPADRLVMYEKFDDFDGGINVGFADGHVEFIQDESQFRKLLQTAEQKQKQADGQH